MKTEFYYTALFITIISFGNAKGQVIMTSTELSFNSILSCTTQDILQRNFVHSETPVPLHLYTTLQCDVQKSINYNTNELIITSLSVSDSSNWMPYEREQITPDTWLWIDLVTRDSSSFVSLRRPIGWFVEQGNPSNGSEIQITVPEMDIEQIYYVRDIRKSQLDTRIINQVQGPHSLQPITGKFHHRSTDVYELILEGLSDTIRVTGMHRFWSPVSSSWVAARNITPDNKITTYDGHTRIVSVKKLTGKFDVYNLELYRSHNYHVSPKGLLAHNSCADLTRVSERLNDISKTVYVSMNAGLYFSWWRSGDVIGLKLLSHASVNDAVKALKELKFKTAEGIKTTRILGLNKEVSKKLVAELEKDDLVDASWGKYENRYYVDVQVLDGLNSGWVTDQ